MCQMYTIAVTLLRTPPSSNPNIFPQSFNPSPITVASLMKSFKFLLSIPYSSISDHRRPPPPQSSICC
ncbi:hypothetical protein L6452_04691 [Arctium lappa]|uniref:Uncharacterized protein n=1 Tax=Arctium lappa TaxID=4217 RepID=A0ACB9EEB9_ARCLA|nr:hypothetical protein L6452_04691 [Arctium lappa]